MKISTYIKLAAAFTVIVLVLGFFFWFRGLTEGDHFSFGSDEKIDVTPTQIMSIKAIGEWEFLAVANEELVDTVRPGLLKDDHLARLYYGTIRLGINMHQVKPRWLTVQGDTVTAVLPKVGLLDKDFIDEARTKSFYESGRWQAKDREALYKKAYRQMLNRCLTPANLQTARENAEAQFRKMMLSMGYKNVQISFEQ